MVNRFSFLLTTESLGEQRIRDLNDEINKLLREKAQWERRIIELGGPNYRVRICLPYSLYVEIRTCSGRRND